MIENTDAILKSEGENDNAEGGQERSGDTKVLPLRPPPAKWDQSKLLFFNDTEHRLEIQSLAVGLTEAEVLQYYGITIDQLSPYDRWFFQINFNRGRIEGKKKAVDSLFIAMGRKNDCTASLAYLNRFADKWPESDARQDSGRILKVFLE